MNYEEQQTFEILCRDIAQIFDTDILRFIIEANKAYRKRIESLKEEIVSLRNSTLCASREGAKEIENKVAVLTWSEELVKKLTQLYGIIVWRGICFAESEE